jgi:hypothetical protein
MGSELRSVPPGLARSAMAEGRRIRTRRRLAVTAGAVAAVVAVLLPAVVLAGRDDRPPVSVPADDPRLSLKPVDPPAPEFGGSAEPSTAALPGGWRVMGAGPLALNSAGIYLQSNPAMKLTQVAPAGYRVLQQADRHSTVYFTDPGGDNSVGSGPEWGNGIYHWSPTGDRVVTFWAPKDGVAGFAIIDARTGNVIAFTVDRAKYDCSRCTYGFTRDGKEVVMPLADRSGGEAVERVRGLQFFDVRTGNPTRTLIAPVQVPDSPYAFSPDGKFLVAESGDTPGQYVLVNLKTRETKPFPYAAVWVTDAELLAPVGTDIAILRADGAVTGRVPVGVPGPVRAPIVLGPPA